mgnify:CR=1 FL=1
MRRKTTQVAALTLTAAMALSFVGCSGGSGSSSTAQNAAKESTSSASTEQAEGKVLNIWCWNDEFQGRFNTYYPEVASVSDDKTTTTLKNGITVKWTINPNEHNNYQNKLDQALMQQESTETDKKIDMFLMEADYALKYANSDFSLDVKKDVGLTDDDLSEQYQYTQDLVTNKDGAIKGVSWQATPGVFAYRRSYAKDILGTDDPEKVQEQLSDWDKFDAAAQKAKTKGYYMLSGFDDSYRTFSNNVSSPWVTGTTVTVDPMIMKWVEQTKTYTDKGYNHKATGLFDCQQWTADQGPDSKVFGFFYSTWGVNFTLEGNSLKTPVAEGGKEEAGNGAFGDWAICTGPANYYWGGTWLTACKGTDNMATIKDVMQKLTCDKDIMKKVTSDTLDYTNNKSAMTELANSDFKSDFLGGQNPLKSFTEAAPKINMSNNTAYDQGCNEAMQTQFADYFNGTIDLAKAKTNFEQSIKETYPEITEVKWPS